MFHETTLHRTPTFTNDDDDDDDDDDVEGDDDNRTQPRQRWLDVASASSLLTCAPDISLFGLPHYSANPRGG